MPTLGEIASGVIPAGQYVVTVDSVEKRTSRSGNPKVAFEATITQGPSKGEKIVWSRSLQPNALWKLATDLVAAGASAETELPDSPNAREQFYVELCQQLRRTVLEIEVTVETRDRGTFNDVSIIGQYGPSREVGRAATANLSSI